MKKIVLLLLVALCLLSLSISAFSKVTPEKPEGATTFVANSEDPNEAIATGGGMITFMHPTQMIGTVRYCVEEIQRLTGLINEAICLNDDVSYDAKMAEMAELIMQANSAMSDSGIPNRLNLWTVYSQLRQRKGDGCNAGTDPLAHADWAREELDRVGQQIGSIEFDNCPYGNKRTWAAGEWWFVTHNLDSEGNVESSEWRLQRHDLLWEVTHCYKNGSMHWKPIEGAYDDKIEDVLVVEGD